MMNATEVQAEIYSMARDRGWEARLEVSCGVLHEWSGRGERQRKTKSCRFDVLIIVDGIWVAIVETKPRDNRRSWDRSRRRARYASHGVPVLFAGPNTIQQVIAKLAELISSVNNVGD